MPSSPPPDPHRPSTHRIALGVLLALTFLVVAWMAAPLLVGLALGTVVGFTAQPLQMRLATRLGGRGTLASALTTLLVGALCIAGGAAALWGIGREVVGAVQALDRTLTSGSNLLAGPRADAIFRTLHTDRAALLARVHEEVGRLTSTAATAAGMVVQLSAGVLLTVVVALWTTYYVLLDWPRIGRHLERLLPLDPLHTRALVDEFRDVGRRAFVGTVASAIVQGVVAGVGFAVVGLPQAAVWGAMLAVLSFIPVVGTMLVWVPAALWLLGTGSLAKALVLVAWSLVLVMAANDYVIKPRLVGGAGDTHPLLMLVALIGGISVFGVAGVIVGPVIASLFVATARIYERESEAQAQALSAPSEPPNGARNPPLEPNQPAYERARPAFRLGSARSARRVRGTPSAKR